MKTKEDMKNEERVLAEQRRKEKRRMKIISIFTSERFWNVILVTIGIVGGACALWFVRMELLQR